MKKIIGTIVNPILFVLQIMFALASVILLGSSIIGLFIEIPGDVYLFSMILTGFPRFIVMIVGSVFLFILAYLCHKTIKKIGASNIYVFVRIFLQDRIKIQRTHDIKQIIPNKFYDCM